MILNMEFCGLMKVISGGQCGVDRAGLEAAAKHHIQTGGTAPQGWRTWFGPAPELGSMFGLVEHWSPNYQYRTKQNIQDSDGTLILATNFGSVGTALTINTCRLHGKPVYLIDLNAYDPANVERVTSWLKEHSITTLNIAGNRDTRKNTRGQVNFERSFAFLDDLFSHLDQKNLLVTAPHK